MTFPRGVNLKLKLGAWWERKPYLRESVNTGINTGTVTNGSVNSIYAGAYLYFSVNSIHGSVNSIYAGAYLYLSVNTVYVPMNTVYSQIQIRSLVYTVYVPMNTVYAGA